MSFEHSIQRVMSGEARGVLPSLGRVALAGIEPFYRLAVNRRNSRYDRSLATVRKLPRPVISVGNLTTGGTGKTPVIRWLAGALRDRGLSVAILARGYKASPGTLGDEQRMLLALLDRPASPGQPSLSTGLLTPDLSANDARPKVLIECDPDRHAAGLRVLDRHPAVDLFLLDDGFQHRRLHRDLDLVLLHAGEPFGFGHVLPRGLLREPITSLTRAGVVILTSSDAVTDERREGIIAEVRRHNALAPIVLERHEPTGLRSASVTSDQPVDVPLDRLRDRTVFCFSGLGSPGGFERQVRQRSGGYAGEYRFRDHHDYTAGDLEMLRTRAHAAGANVLVTTEKDWVKLSPLESQATGRAAMTGDDGALPIWRLDVEARFDAQGAERLIERVLATLPTGAATPDTR